MDVYKIGVSIALANGVSSVLAVIQKDVLGLHKAVNLTNAGLNRMKVAVLGIGAVAFGGAMLSGLMKLEKAGEKYTHQLELMRASAGMTFDEVQKAQVQANLTAANVLTTIPSENLKAIRELRAVFPHYEDALHNLDIVQKASAVMANLRDAQGNKHGLAHGTEQVYEMSKAAEMQGAAQDPERFRRMIDGMVKASQWSGGKITGSDFHSMLKYMRGAGINLSDRFVMEMLPSLIQEFKTGKGGASGVGVGFAGLMRYIVGGHMSHRSITAGLQYGLIDPTKVIRKPNGSIAGLKERAFYGADLAQSDFDQWVDKFALPALKARGVNMADPKKLAAVIGSIFEGRVSQQFIEQFIIPNLRARLDQDVPKITGAGGVAAYTSLSRNDPVMVRDQFHKQVERIAESLGKLAAPMVTEVLYKMTQALAWFAGVIERNPTAVKWLLAVIAGISGLLVIMGTLAIVAAGISALGGAMAAGVIGLVIAGILAIGAGIVWLSTKSEAIGARLQAAWRAVVDWVSSIGRAASDLVATIKNGAAQIMEQARAFGAQAVAAVSAALSSVAGAIMQWAASLPARAMEAVGIKPAAPGTENAPNGMPRPGPTFGPQRPGDPSQAPGLLQRQSFTPPSSGGERTLQPVVMQMDGQTIGKLVLAYATRGATGAGRGQTGYDLRTVPVGGMGGAALA